jgi:hypothetical protein
MTDSKLEHLDVAFECKFDDSDPDFFFFEGLASTFNNRDLVEDTIKPGTFVDSIAAKMPKILWQHDREEPIGMPVDIRETAEGLFLRGRLPKADTFVSGRVIPQVKVGSIDAMSIGFRVLESHPNPDDPTNRIITKINLVEVSLVTFPADPKALITGFKSLSEVEQKKFLDEVSSEDSLTMDMVTACTDLKEFESLLRESAGFSKSLATTVASNCKSLFESQSDSDPEDDLSEVESKLLDMIRSQQLSTIYRKVNQNV